MARTSRWIRTPRPRAAKRTAALTLNCTQTQAEAFEPRAAARLRLWLSEPMAELLTIRKETSRTTKLILAVAAWGLVVICWELITRWELISRYVFPTPMEVVR